MKIPINKTRLKIAVLKWHPGLPGANELKRVIHFPRANELIFIYRRMNPLFFAMPHQWPVPSTGVVNYCAASRNPWRCSVTIARWHTWRTSVVWWRSTTGWLRPWSLLRACGSLTGSRTLSWPGMGWRRRCLCFILRRRRSLLMRMRSKGCENDADELLFWHFSS